MKLHNLWNPRRAAAAGIFLAALAVALLGTSGAEERDDADLSDSAESSTAESPAASPQETRSPKSYTDAERVAGLQQILEEDKQRLVELRVELETLEPEFEQASEKFSQLEAAVAEKKKQVEARSDDTPAEEVETMRAELAELESRWKAAHEMFDLIIQRRKATQSQTATLEEKTLLEQAGLDRLLGASPPPTDEPSAGQVSPEVTPSAESVPIDGSPETAPPDRSETVADIQERPTAIDSPQADEEVADTPSADPRIEAARKEFKAKQSELQEAEQRVERLNRVQEVFEQDIANEQQLMESAQQEVQLGEETLRRLRDELEPQTTSDAPAKDLDATRAQIDQTKTELTKASDRAERHAERSASLQEQLAAIQAEREHALGQLRTATSEAESASRRMRLMESPFAPHKIVDWLLSRGPTILFTVFILIGFWSLIRLLARRMIRGLGQRSRIGSAEDREERTQTLVAVFNSVTTIAMVGIGMLAILDQAGVDVTVLMGGAAALGIAIGFGAQNLMRDYFCGSMILAENQYRVGNVVRIAGISGLVENISLRITVLRDLEGVVHFIPHSQIGTVSNLTHGWSRAMFDIGVAYKEDVDRVMDVLMELARELREDDNFRGWILDDPEMLGVDAFGDSAVVIKFLIKTRPLKQWVVKRELLRRIKNRFDELGIEIPFPHRTVYHRGQPPMSESEQEVCISQSDREQNS